MRRVTGFVLVGLMFVAGCGGNSGGSVDQSQGSRPDPDTVAASFGCSSPTKVEGGPELFAAAAVDCDYKGDSITVMVFQTDDAQQRWKDAARSVTGGDGTVVIGDRFAVEATDADQADEIAAAVHGHTQ